MSASIEPTVIDEDLLRKSVNDQINPEIGEIARREGIEFSEVTVLRLDYKSTRAIFPYYRLRHGQLMFKISPLPLH